ncbi:MAG: metallophosphoesterase [Pseudomonadales bacterium]|nr:metallophosphoesterase [Pseudomonadales bacterium]
MRLSVLQITDTHLRATAGQRLLGVDTQASLEAVLTAAFAVRIPDAVLVTGDIAHDPEPATYERFVALFESYYKGPRLLLAGNHDLWAPLLPHQQQAGSRAPTAEVLSIGAWDLIGLDSHLDDEPGACPPERLLERLQSACADARRAARHVLIALHHPLIPVGSPWLDKDRVHNSDLLLEWLSEHSTAKAVVFGHAHQIVESIFRDIQLLGAPSTCFQFAPHTEKFTIDDRMPGCRWLFLETDGRVSTQVQRLDDFPLTLDLTQRH